MERDPRFHALCRDLATDRRLRILTMPDGATEKKLNRKIQNNRDLADLEVGLDPPTVVSVQARLGGCIRSVMNPEMRKIITKK